MNIRKVDISIINDIAIVKELYDLLESKEGTELKKSVEHSINVAREIAHKELDSHLFDLLYWPTSLDEYYAYLVWYAQWKPVQPNQTGTGWQEPDSGVIPEQQEVFDRLCHWYFLINQKTNTSIDNLQNDPKFSKWMRKYSSTWGDYLNTTDSFNNEILKTFIDDPEFRVSESLVDGKPNSPSGWLTWNQFFARELNPGTRPISCQGNNHYPTFPADCHYRACYHIDEKGNIPEITVKGTHKYNNIQKLLDDETEKYAKEFFGGTFVHYFLGPYSYHRFHTPVSGLVEECRAVTGRTYLQVNIEDGQFNAPDDSENGYEFSQSRGIVIIDTAKSEDGDIGLVATLPIGMAHVSSVHMTHEVGTMAKKGDEFGYFLFGGSDIIMLFGPKQKAFDKIRTDSTVYNLVGELVVKSELN
ncbi:phosphatidylserine decarboxylase [Celerinatantimonas diazotrophica]|uniref:Phosphatidylserine decarboxylase n=1 Tax=Celerinatantimonas diazotrophica TaxID=412034 RepID=A0A4R1K4R4_9GAMM|nr:phosphatidylserine decarboxylase [Celerinatantimonas diazotrophica]TCK58930.1 phosphatidylserine decarboxylase precursor [Celerinatantimonas diazotrophica]CAG9297563.1 Phosphatidylserine decarboxylase proenzyme 2 [Celerinatantimonas diazotrophica]